MGHARGTPHSAVQQTAAQILAPSIRPPQPDALLVSSEPQVMRRPSERWGLVRLAVGLGLVCQHARGASWATPLGGDGGRGRVAAFMSRGDHHRRQFHKLGNETLLRTGPAFFLVANCTVNSPLLIDSPAGPLQTPVGQNLTQGNLLVASRRHPIDRRTPAEALLTDAAQTIGEALMDAFCFWAAAKIVTVVRGLWSRGFNKSPGVRFADVIGCDYAKEEVMQLVDYLKEPAKYKKLGAKIPRGILIVGPPGCGKTLMARALAGEASVPFYYASGAEFAQPYWGMGVHKIKRLFKQARRSKRSIVFIDEFDALARKRRSVSSGSAEADSENTINQLLTEMDGFETHTDSNVIVLASTNRPEVLDSAVVRPGRFDRKVFLDRPDVRGREEHFRRLLSRMQLDKDVDVMAPLMARLTPGYVGAEIVNVVNEAALRAGKLNRTMVTEDDLSWAADRARDGIERQHKIMPEELRRTAWHESGHALLAWMLPQAQAPVKVSIINRGNTLGFNLMEEDSYIKAVTEETIRAEICVLFGGRVAEEIEYGTPSAGASNDLMRASGLATKMVARLGYGKRTGLLTVGELDDISPKTRRVMEQEVQEILKAEYARAKSLVMRHREQVKSMVDLLVEKEVVHSHQIEEVLGPRPTAIEAR